MKTLEKEIFQVKQGNFEEIALRVFEFQYKYVPIYREFANYVKKSKPKSLNEIPFLPIEFFKTNEIICEGRLAKVRFLSSGTTDSNRSQHFVASPQMYQNSFYKTYELFIGNPKDQVILALLPSYLEQGDSSLVYMVTELIKNSGHRLSGFYKDDFSRLIEAYEEAHREGKKVILFGVSYALLDLADLKPNLSRATIIETGGMKGRRKELSKEDLHHHLKQAFQVPYITSEYGMTELLSQGYSDLSGYFKLPSWMKIMIRETNDPFSLTPENKTGGINVIDLANLYSCSFIATQDLGQVSDSGLKLMGRFDHSDIRGCNLMVD